MTAPPSPPNAPNPIPNLKPAPGKKRLFPQTTKKIVRVTIEKFTRSVDNPLQIKKQTSVYSFERLPDRNYFLARQGSEIRIMSALKSSGQILAPASTERKGVSDSEDDLRIPETPPEMQGRTIV